MKKIFLITFSLLLVSSMAKAGKDKVGLAPTQPWGPRGPVVIYKPICPTCMPQLHTMFKVFKCNNCQFCENYKLEDYPTECPNCHTVPPSLPVMTIYQGSGQLPGKPSNQ